MINCVVYGRVASEPELRNFGDGILKLRIASNEKQKIGGEWKEITTWLNVDVFGKRGTALHKILTKGTPVLIRGTLSTREFTSNGVNKTSLEIRADDVILLDRINSKNTSTATAEVAVPAVVSSFNPEDEDYSFPEHKG